VVSSGDARPFLRAFAAFGLKRIEPIGEDILLAASSLSPSRVARVSRFKDHFDSTALRRGWQVS